ncbi:MAG TPA: outer membrane protein [Xanthobacteraceae bacterium]|nr:outer membrane protein [Xanthobacteraceae bacterium]
MKRLLLATVSALALASVQPGRAADLRMPLKAPPMIKAFSWTGCYVGGHGGWGWGQKTFSDTSTVFGDDLIAFFTDASSKSFDVSGGVLGAQIGCDYQFAPGWVVGVEGNSSWTDINGKFDCTSPTCFGPVHLDSDTDWMASVTARLGYAWTDRWLLYVKGGAGWVRDEYEINTYLGNWSAAETRTGWTIGGGLEWAFADNWSAKLEYQYYDFGNRDLTFTLPDGTSPEIEKVRQQISTVTAGINFRFH